MTDERFASAPSVKSRRLNVLPENPDSAALGRFPKWLHRKMPEGRSLWSTHEAVDCLPTVCEEAKCPNMLECWTKKTATFLALGKDCTRNCGFCDIDFDAHPQAPDENEPNRIADSAKKLGLKHVVVTMVARDDLPDKGAGHIAAIIREVKKIATIEVLTSDFSGDEKALQVVLEAGPDIFNHNIETVERLTPRVRHKAQYDRTLRLLEIAGQSKSLTKSGLMVGLGESPQEVEKTMDDLHRVGCQIITIGQYLQPNRRKLRVKSFVTPEQFDEFAAYGKKIGVPFVYAGPFVRSSYNAAAVFEALNGSKDV